MPDQANTGDQITNLEMSATPTDNEGATVTATPGGDGEHTEPKVEEPQNMADAIEAALEAAPEGEAPKSETPAEGDDDGEADDPDADADKPTEGEGGEAPAPEETEPEDDGDELSDDPTDDELKGATPRAQKRIAKLLTQRKEAQREVETLRPDAENFRQVQSFMSENNLADAEVANLFQAGAALKSGTPDGYKKFLELAAPLVQQALEATGQTLPADLRSQVDAGDMTEDVALEMGRSRHATAHAQAQAQQAASQVEATVAGQTQAQIAQAVTAWSHRTQTTDPDFSRKTDVMKRVSQALVAENGLPQTPEAAVEMAQKAHTEATQILRSAAPARPTRQQPTSSASSPRTGVKVAPTSLADIVSQGLGG
jgi:hypothetical protein